MIHITPYLLILLSLAVVMSAPITKVPLKLIAFDLDGTLWDPDMYKLYGGSPFHLESDEVAIGSKGEKVSLLGITSKVFDYLHDNKIIIAVASCTDEPAWADELLRKFKTPSNRTLFSLIESSQIFRSNKQVHFNKIKKQYPHIKYEEMLFFDNESTNIRNVKQLGVRCVYCPDGVTTKAWNEGLQMFEMNKLQL